MQNLKAILWYEIIQDMELVYSFMKFPQLFIIKQIEIVALKYFLEWYSLSNLW